MKPIKEPLVFGNQSVQTFDARKVLSERNDESFMDSGQGLVQDVVSNEEKTARIGELGSHRKVVSESHSNKKFIRKDEVGPLITELPQDDPSSLYLRDCKYFMSLRNAQINFKNRREVAN